MLKETAVVRLFGLFKVPLIFAVSPRVLQLNDERCEVRIPLNRLTKNHLGSMYFGALAIGADSVVGMLAYHLTRKKGGKVILAFKDFHAEFLRRPEKAVTFVCEEGKAMKKFVDEVLSSTERQNRAFPAFAYVEGESEPVARFTLTLSLKKKT